MVGVGVEQEAEEVGVWEPGRRSVAGATVEAPTAAVTKAEEKADIA